METIQNLHNYKIQVILKIKTSIVFVLILWSCPIFSQEKDINETNNLKFQEHFFDAITQKSINNYHNAINHLEDCNQLFPNNKAVLFELSKNYLKLNKTTQAVEYVNEALLLEPNNIWLLEHLVKVYKRERNYIKAITVQEQIAKKHPKKRKEIVYLHLLNRDEDAAKKTLEELAKAKLLNSRLRRIREKLTTPKKATPILNANTIKGSLEEEYLKNKSFVNLKKLLKEQEKKDSGALLKYSNEGMSLFPAQPMVYLMHGKALNLNKEYKKAVKSLQNGIDFVIDDNSLEKRFYTQLLIAYKGLGDNKNITKYQKKI